MEPVAFPEFEQLGKRLQILRLERRLTQRAVAECAGISNNHYQAIENAQANVTVAVLLKIMETFGVSIGDVFEPHTVAPSGHRVVYVGDLKELATRTKQFTDIVERLADAVTWPRTGPSQATSPLATPSGELTSPPQSDGLRPAQPICESRPDEPHE